MCRQLKSFPYKPPSAAFFVLCLLVVVAFRGVALAADCDGPHYRKGRIYEDSKSETGMQISILPNEFAPARLICLAKHLRRRFRDKEKVLITIYDDDDAARQDLPLTVEASAKQFEMAGHMHASYESDANKKEEYLVLYPDPLEKDSSTRIDLSSSELKPCNLQLAGRCLLMLHHIEYPWSMLKSGTTGKAIVTGTITPEGTVLDVHVAAAEASPPTGKDTLADAAAGNLRTWRFESAPRSEPIRITFSFEVVTSPSFGGNTKVQLSLPTQVLVRANRPSYVPVN